MYVHSIGLIIQVPRYILQNIHVYKLVSGIRHFRFCSGSQIYQNVHNINLWTSEVGTKYIAMCYLFSQGKEILSLKKNNKQRFGNLCMVEHWNRLRYSWIIKMSEIVFVEVTFLPRRMFMWSMQSFS